MWRRRWRGEPGKNLDGTGRTPGAGSDQAFPDGVADQTGEDRKSTRLNSSHGYISYAVFCLKKKKNNKSHIILGGLAVLAAINPTHRVYCTVGDEHEYPPAVGYLHARVVRHRPGPSVLRAAH